MKEVVKGDTSNPFDGLMLSAVTKKWADQFEFFQYPLIKGILTMQIKKNLPMYFPFLLFFAICTPAICEVICLQRYKNNEKC